MTNKEIAKKFNLFASIMQLHNEPPFRIKNYSNAYIQLRKVQRPISEMTTEEISSLSGVGKSTLGKIEEMLSTGTFAAFEKYVQNTPSGIIDILGIINKFNNSRASNSIESFE